MAKKFNIFVSHVAAEAELAAELKRCLEDDFTTLAVFVSSDGASIEAGEWFKQVKSGLAESKVVIVLCSPDSIRQPWVAFEAGAAWLSKGVRLVMLCHSGLLRAALPPPFNQLQSVEVNHAGLAWIYQQIKDKFDSIRRAPGDERVAAAVRRLDAAVQKTIVGRQLREQVDCVMALSFRDPPGGREYLLVRTTSGGKWVFPKGSIRTEAERVDHLGLLRKELLAEAGAGGEASAASCGPFSYFKNDGERRTVLAFPVRVNAVAPPREAGRAPRWCDFDQATALLQEGRSADAAAGLLQALDFVSQWELRP